MKEDSALPRPGMVTDAKILKVMEDSFKVKLMPEKCSAILPFEHLSDYSDMRELWRLSLSKGDKVQKITPFNRNEKLTISRRECLVRAAGEKIFAESFNDLKEGMLLPGVVKNHQDFGFFVELAGGHTGLCPATSLPSVEKSALKDYYPEGRSVLAFVKKIGNVKGRFLVSVAKQDCKDDPVKSLTDYLQSRDEALKNLSKKNENLKKYCDVAVGSIVEVTISSIKKKRVLCDTASGLQASATDDHYGYITPEKGKQYPAVVLDVDVFSPRLQVSLDPRLCNAFDSSNKSPSPEIGQTVEGELILKKEGCLVMKLKSHDCNKLLYIPATEHFNSIKETSKWKIGMCHKVVVKGQMNRSLIGVLDKGTDSDVEIGDIVEAKVKAVHPLEMTVVAKGFEGRVHITEMADDVEEGKNPLQDYKAGMGLKVKVIAKKTDKSSKPSTPFFECSLKQSKMDKTNSDELLNEELLTSRGAEMTVFIKHVDNSKISVQASLMHFGFISMFNVSDDINTLNEASSHFKVGHALKATVSGKTHEDQIIFSLMNREDVEPEVGMQVIAMITDVQQSKPLCLRLPNGLKGVAEMPKGSSLQYSTGRYVRCEVLSISIDGVCKLNLLRKRKASSMSEDDETTKKSKQAKKKRKKNSQTSDIESSRMEVESDEEINSTTKKSITNTDNNASQSKPDNFKKIQTSKERLSIAGFAWGGDLNIQQTKKDDNDDDDDDDDNGIETKPVKTDNKSKKKESRREEKMIDEYEKQQLKGNTGPHNVNDFERLVLQSPNSSMVWLGYMSYHLELGEVAKARTVAEKALNTIGFREEQEKKNVWLAYLNLEVMYGESEDLKKLLQRAITYNDPFEIQLKMCDIYIGAGKMEDAELQFELLIRKFKKEKSVWKSYAQFLYTQNKQAAARNVLKKCLTALEKRDHVEVITRFACLEFSHGNSERGRTLFENLIASYPQRTDIWSVYIDIVVKSGDITGARQLLERAVQQKLNVKKVSFLMKKFIKFEETHGTEDQVNRVKDMAISIFQSEN